MASLTPGTLAPFKVRPLAAQPLATTKKPMPRPAGTRPRDTVVPCPAALASGGTDALGRMICSSVTSSGERGGFAGSKVKKPTLLENPAPSFRNVTHRSASWVSFRLVWSSLLSAIWVLLRMSTFSGSINAMRLVMSVGRLGTGRSAV